MFGLFSAICSKPLCKNHILNHDHTISMARIDTHRREAEYILNRLRDKTISEAAGRGYYNNTLNAIENMLITFRKEHGL